MNRLEKVEPELWVKLKAATTESRLIAVMHACEFAIRATGTDASNVHEAFERIILRDEFTDEEIDEMLRVVEALDERYFELKETNKAAAQVYFDKARTAAAIAFAMQPSTDNSAAESIYEAYSAVPDIDAFLKVVHASMDQLETFLS